MTKAKKAPPVLFVRVSPRVHEGIEALMKSEHLSKTIVCEILLRRALGYGELLSGYK